MLNHHLKGAPPTLPHFDQAMSFPLEPFLTHKMFYKCIARNRDGLMCNRSTSGSSKWCSFHEEQQSKRSARIPRESTKRANNLNLLKNSLKTYKRYSAAYQDFVDRACCECLTAKAELSLERLRVMHAECRTEWVLAGKARDARIKHHDAFYCGGDCGHSQYIESLTKRQANLETMMLSLDEQAYAIILQNEKAHWLDDCCEQTTPYCQLDGCRDDVEFGEDNVAASDSESLPSLTDSASDSADEQTSDLHLNLAETLAIHSECVAPTISAKPSTLTLLRDRFLCNNDLSNANAQMVLHHKIVRQIFRICAAQSPSLLVRAQPHESIETFLSEDSLSPKDIKNLGRTLCLADGPNSKGKITPAVVRQAIVEVSSGVWNNSTAKKIAVLGAYVSDGKDENRLTLEQWLHVHSFIACLGCGLSCAATFEEWAYVKRAVSRSPHFHNWAEDSEFPSDLRHRGIAAVASHKSPGRTIERIKAKGKGMKNVWIEKESRCWTVLRFARHAENADRICDILARASDILVILRDAQSKAILCSPPEKKAMWTERLRSGYGAADRKSRAWSIQSWFCESDALDRFSQHFPERRFNKYFTDTYEALVMANNSDVSWQQFVQSLVKSFDNVAEIKVDEISGLDGEVIDRARHIFRL